MNNAYIVSTDSEGFLVGGHSLYTACRTAKHIGNGANVLLDGRLVAFAFDGHVRVGFGAHPAERAEIVDAFGEAPALTR